MIELKEKLGDAKLGLQLVERNIISKDNTATVWIKPKDLEAVIRKHGNILSYVEI